MHDVFNGVLQGLREAVQYADGGCPRARVYEKPVPLDARAASPARDVSAKYKSKSKRDLTDKIT